MARASIKHPKLGYVIIAAIFSVTAWFSFNADPQPKETYNSTDLLTVHFLDVGQADAILIHQGEYAMLIDAGNNDDTEEVMQYLKDENIETLNYIVGTHPHEDHIGGLDGIIKNFDIGTILMPKVSHNTRTYEDVLLAIKNKGLKITSPKVGQQYSLGNAQFTIYSPSKDNYKELNAYSIAIKLFYKEKSFLLLADCEQINEKEMLQWGLPLDADVMKLGHHGSNSSTLKDFLTAVDPQYAVISVGKDNDYNHPSKEVITRIKEHSVELLRTDENGTIVFSTNGESLTVKKNNP